MNLKEGNGPHPIQLLPTELRGEIFNKLEQNEIPNVRLVSKQWAKEIEDLYNYEIYLNEESPGLEYILQLRIVTLNIEELVGDRIQILPDPDQESDQIPKLTFKYPTLIRRIQISSSVPTHCLHELILLCQKTLVHLDIVNGDSHTTTARYQIPTPVPLYELTSLKSLNLSLNLEVKGLTAGRFFWHQLVCSNLSKLEHLGVNICGTSMLAKGVWDDLRDLVKLITKNPEGLQILNLIASLLPKKLSGPPPSPPFLLTPDLLALDRVRNLKHIRLHGRIDSEYENILNNLFVRQEKLETLDLNLMPIDGNVLRSTVLNNCETIALVQLRHALVVSADRPLDLSGFRNCSKLKILMISRRFSFSRSDPPILPELINLDELPDSLVNLYLGRMDILSRDILELLDSDSGLLPKLEKLGLELVGPSGDSGVNSAVLERIEGLEMRNLQKLRVDGKYGSNCPEEVSKRTALIKRLGFWPEELMLELFRDESNRLRPDPFREFFSEPLGAMVYTND